MIIKSPDSKCTKQAALTQRMNSLTCSFFKSEIWAYAQPIILNSIDQSPEYSRLG